ncbi:Colicin V production protein (fragment) [mine drainage metagenome]|uniref:Colicin V production protein n=1 Tax=mine drainage metagenome TaxID=410659 RepID=A0A3P3ZPQ9_9ZZZZ
MINDILHSPLWTYFATYTWLDLLLTGILLASILFGWTRGMVREFFSLVSWLLAFWVAHTWSEKLAMPCTPGSPRRSCAGFWLSC